MSGSPPIIPPDPHRDALNADAAAEIEAIDDEIERLEARRAELARDILVDLASRLPGGQSASPE